MGGPFILTSTILVVNTRGTLQSINLCNRRYTLHWPKLRNGTAHYFHLILSMKKGHCQLISETHIRNLERKPGVQQHLTLYLHTLIAWASGHTPSMVIISDIMNQIFVFGGNTFCYEHGEAFKVFSILFKISVITQEADLCRLRNERTFSQM